VFPIEQSLVRLANEVQASHAQYTKLAFLSTPLKYGFTLA
jgi:hypothetical protein